MSCHCDEHGQFITQFYATKKHLTDLKMNYWYYNDLVRIFCVIQIAYHSTRVVFIDQDSGCSLLQAWGLHDSGVTRPFWGGQMPRVFSKMPRVSFQVLVIPSSQGKVKAILR